MSISLFILTLVCWTMRQLLQFFCIFQLHSKDSSGQKGAHEVSSPTSCSQQGHFWGQTLLRRLLRVLSSRVLKTSKIGDCTASLGRLLHCWAAVKQKKLSLIASLNISFPNLCSLSLQPAWVSLNHSPCHWLYWQPPPPIIVCIMGRYHPTQSEAESMFPLCIISDVSYE